MRQTTHPAGPPGGSAKGPGGGRDYRLDFFRGLALVFIFMDHIPDNIPSYFTLRSFALSDAAEVFIFISGYTAALAYGRALLREGAPMACAHVWRRAWQLYVAHLCLFMLFNAQVSFTMRRFNNPLFADELGIGAYLEQPEEAILRVLLLQLQPSFLNILPLYIALLAGFPLVLLALRTHLLLALLPSAALWGAVQIWSLNLPGYPGERAWYFNPLAWQFLFVIAACFGFRQATGRPPVPPLPRWLLPLAAGFAAVGCVMQGATMLHALLGARTEFLMPPLWMVDKTPLPPLRLASMLALAYLVATLVPRDARFLTSRPGWLLVLCGQQSLYVFCLGILLSVLGNTVLTTVGGRLGMQVVVNAAGIALMIGFGLVLSWYSGGGHLPARPRPLRGGMRGAALAALLTVASATQAAAEPAACPVPEEAALAGIALPAARVEVERNGRLVVLALGSSSTLGRAAQGAEYSYPARLQARLRAALPGVEVTVVVSAAPRRSVRAALEDLPADLARTGARLVIWSAGGVEAGRGSDPLALAEDIGTGIGEIRAAGADVILVDAQFAPSVSRIVDLGPYREAIRRSGASNDVPVLDRYELMRSWSASGLLELDATEPQARVQVARRLFDCLAAALAEAIAPAVRDDQPP